MADGPDELPTGLPGPTRELLWRARQARIGRDQWRTVGATLCRLRAANVDYRTIERETGIPKATAKRLVTQELIRPRDSPW